MTIPEVIKQGEEGFEDAVPTFHSQDCKIGHCSCDEDIKSFLHSQNIKLLKAVRDELKYNSSESMGNVLDEIIKSLKNV